MLENLSYEEKKKKKTKGLTIKMWTGKAWTNMALNWHQIVKKEPRFYSENPLYLLVNTKLKYKFTCTSLHTVGRVPMATASDRYQCSGSVTFGADPVQDQDP